MRLNSYDFNKIGHDGNNPPLQQTVDKVLLFYTMYHWMALDGIR
jgi:hypothetical protein